VSDHIVVPHPACNAWMRQRGVLHDRMRRRPPLLCLRLGCELRELGEHKLHRVLRRGSQRQLLLGAFQSRL